jgi:hypothetical protein
MWKWLELLKQIAPGMTRAAVIREVRRIGALMYLAADDPDSPALVAEDDIRRQSNQFGRISANAVEVAPAPAVVDLNIAALDPA